MAAITSDDDDDGDFDPEDSDCDAGIKRGVVPPRRARPSRAARPKQRLVDSDDDDDGDEQALRADGKAVLMGSDMEDLSEDKGVVTPKPVQVRPLPGKVFQLHIPAAITNGCPCQMLQRGQVHCA